MNSKNEWIERTSKNNVSISMTFLFASHTYALTHSLSLSPSLHFFSVGERRSTADHNEIHLNLLTATKNAKTTVIWFDRQCIIKYSSVTSSEQCQIESHNNACHIEYNYCKLLFGENNALYSI